MSNINAKTLNAIRHAGKTYQILENKTATSKKVVVDMLFKNKIPVGFNKQIEGTKMYRPEAESLRNGIVEGMGKMAYYVFTADPKELTKDQMTARRSVIDPHTKLLELAVTSDKNLDKIEDAKFDVLEAKEALAKYITILNTKI